MIYDFKIWSLGSYRVVESRFSTLFVSAARASPSIRNRTQHERAQCLADGFASVVAGGGVGDQEAEFLQELRSRAVRFCGHCDDVVVAGCEPGNWSTA